MRWLLMVPFALLLTGCAPVPEVRQDAPVPVAYVPEGAPRLTLFTMVNNRTGGGGHSSLMISGSEQVIFDPAGSFRPDGVVARGDVLYGMTPAWVMAYKSAHARSTFHVVTQEIPVTQAQADRALSLAKGYGRVPSAFCTNATTRILREVPGFGDVDVTFYPKKLMEQIARRDDVRIDRYYENDDGDVVDGITPAAG